MKFVIEEDPEFTYGANDTRLILLYMVAERGFEEIKYDHLLAFHQLSVIMGRTALHDTIVFNDKGLLPTREKYHGISGVGKRFVKWEKHLLMWKLISVSCTLSWLCFFYRACPSRYPFLSSFYTLSRRRSRGSHKKTLAFSCSFFPLSHFCSHSSHLSSLRHRGEAENLVYFSTISLI